MFYPPSLYTNPNLSVNSIKKKFSKNFRIF